MVNNGTMEKDSNPEMKNANNSISDKIYSETLFQYFDKFNNDDN